mmetsp:Transcript_26795/g.90233  ORF Transcript_26795/g.90233 Transcript_26795/m.90233 type:complete len:231 (+) Transcript_26795:1048-1740(+)
MEGDVEGHVRQFDVRLLAKRAPDRADVDGAASPQKARECELRRRQQRAMPRHGRPRPRHVDDQVVADGERHAALAVRRAHAAEDGAVVIKCARRHCVRRSGRTALVVPEVFEAARVAPLLLVVDLLLVRRGLTADHRSVVCRGGKARESERRRERERPEGLEVDLDIDSERRLFVEEPDDAFERRIVGRGDGTVEDHVDERGRGHVHGVRAEHARVVDAARLCDHPAEQR